MCCFSRAVEHVGATQIFARAVADGRQLLVYSMSLRVAEPLAMILPLPVPPRPPEDAVRFIDLSGYEHFFRDLRAAFPPLYTGEPSRGGAAPASAGSKLAVHRVGAFEASFVPSLRDFARLDERFRLAPEVWSRLPGYADWGFAVFQLAPQKSWLRRATDQTVHPMAFEFPRRDAGELFFPTLHVHDGVLHERAQFDHTLFCQADGIVAATLGWARSTGPLGARVDEKKARGVVRAEAGGFARPLAGEQLNRDTVVRTPAWSGGDLFRAAGDCWSARLCGAFAQHDPDTLAPEQRAWRETALERLDRVFAALRDGVAELVARRRVAWQLATGPDTVEFRPAGPRVEPQEVTLSFAAPPSAETWQEIDGELRALLARAV